MIATVLCESKVKGVIKTENEYNTINYIVTDCKSAPFIVGMHYWNVCLADEWEWLNVDEGKSYEVVLSLYPNNEETANAHLHFSVSTTGHKLVGVSSDD